MNYDVTMPSLGADMDWGKLMDWKIKPGDTVKKGQTIAVIETTKSAVEIESFRDGKVLDLVGHVGEQIPVGQVIAHFDIEGKEPTRPAAPAPAGRQKVSPAARRLAQENTIDLTNVKGSGVGGTIELKDVEVMVKKAPAPSAPAESVVNIRQAIAKLMSQSKKEIPHYYLKSEISLDVLMKWIDEKNETLPPEQRLMMPVVLIRAIIVALEDSPEMNGHYKNGKFEKSETVNLGMAIALKSGGVLVPALLEANKKSLNELNISLQDLLVRTRKGELKNRELTEGTITVTNVGDLGTHEVFGIIFPPQVAIIGLGRVRKKAVVDGNNVRPGFVIDVTLSADHRVTDGLIGARFLGKIESALKDPRLLEG